MDAVIKTYPRFRQSCIFVYLLLLSFIQKTNEHLGLCSVVFILENMAHFCNFCLMLLYGCATWCLTLKEEHSLVESEDTVVSKKVWCKRDEVTRGGEENLSKG